MVRPDRLSRHPTGERPLASADLVDGARVTATRSGLVVAGRDGAVLRRGWHEVDHGVWDDEATVLTVTWVDASDPTVLHFAGAAPRRFLVLVRERVQASVVHVDQIDLRSGGIARAAIRRTGDGALLSQVIVEARAGLSADERRAVTTLEARARHDVGLPT